MPAKELSIADYDKQYDDDAFKVIVVYKPGNPECESLLPMLDDLSEELEDPVYKISVDVLGPKVRSLGISRYPAFVFVKNKDVQHVEFALKTKDEIKNKITKYKS